MRREVPSRCVLDKKDSLQRTKKQLWLQRGALCVGGWGVSTLLQARDRHFQAVLPLRGKILNAEKCSGSRLFANEEIKVRL